MKQVDTLLCDLPLCPDSQANAKLIQAVFKQCSDWSYRNIKKDDGDFYLFYFVTIVDLERIEREIIVFLESEYAASYLVDQLPIANLTTYQTYRKVVDAINHGQIILLAPNQTLAYGFTFDQAPKRSIMEPNTEMVIRGPRESFIEHIATNLGLLRQKLQTEKLKTIPYFLGEYTRTKVVIAYLEDICELSLIEEVKLRLSRIKIDSILESGYIEEWIEDNPFSPFPQMQNTERPDVVAALLLEGRVAIFVDGTPFVLLAPINLFGALASPEDYYERYLIATMVRWLRFIFAVVSLTLPSLYVAITTFHPDFLPIPLLISIAAARENTPLPAAVEAFFMEITFEALREAGVRLPKAIGQAVSIVGALVIGQAAVQAGIISAPMVIIVSITGIASFTIPRFNFAIALRMLRFPIILLSGALGIFGLILGILAILIHLCGLRSFGVPYLMPIAPFHFSGMKDTFVRAPRWAMMRRPEQTSKKNRYRQTSSGTPEARLPTGNHHE